MPWILERILIEMKNFPETSFINYLIGSDTPNPFGIQPDHKTIVNKFQNKREAHDFTMHLYDQCLRDTGVVGYKVFKCRRKIEKPMKNFLGERHAD